MRISADIFTFLRLADLRSPSFYIGPLATEDVLCALYAEYMTTALHTGMWVTNGSLKGAQSTPKKALVLNIRDRWGGGRVPRFAVSRSPTAFPGKVAGSGA